jgi:hypothetical protein
MGICGQPGYFCPFFGVVFLPQHAIHTRILANKGFCGQP